MNVQDLIDLLQRLVEKKEISPNTPIVVASDEEGNAYRSLEAFSVGIYDKQTYDRVYPFDDEDQTEPVPDYCIKALCLWP